MTAHAQHHTPGLWCSGCRNGRDKTRIMYGTKKRARYPIVKRMPRWAHDLFLQRCEQLDVHRVDVLGPTRDTTATAWARAQIVTELWETGLVPYNELGRWFGRDHSSVMSMVRKVQAMAKEFGLDRVAEMSP